MINLIPHTKDLKILCLGAHSDDIEIGCGGTLIKILSNYNVTQIKWVVFATNEERKKEALNSANIYLKDIKNKNISIFNFRDGFLPYHAIEIKEEFEKLKKEIDPDIIFTHYHKDKHQDHRLINELTWNTYRNHLILEYEIPKWDGDIGNPNFFVDLNENTISRKNQLLQDCFISQTSKHWFDNETFKALPRIRGMESASKYSEAFYSRKTNIF